MQWALFCCVTFFKLNIPWMGSSVAVPGNTDLLSNSQTVKERIKFQSQSSDVICKWNKDDILIAILTVEWAVARCWQPGHGHVLGPGSSLPRIGPPHPPPVHPIRGWSLLKRQQEKIMNNFLVLMIHEIFSFSQQFSSLTVRTLKVCCIIFFFQKRWSTCK
jgi:hypothetical protein